MATSNPFEEAHTSHHAGVCITGTPLFEGGVRNLEN